MSGSRLHPTSSQSHRQSPQSLFGPYLSNTDPQNRLEAVIALAEAATHEDCADAL